MRSLHENKERVSCNTGFMGHLGRRIRRRPSFLYLTQDQIKIRSKNSNFETQHFLFKTSVFCPVLSQDSKNAICFDVRQLKIPNIAFQRSDVITFTWLLGHCTAKNKDIGSKFCSLAVAI